MKVLLTISCLFLTTLFVFGQQRTVKGRLISIEDRTPIPGWTVMEPGTTNGTVTDINGEFTLTIKSSPAIILFPGCFNTLYVEYKDNVDFKEVVLGTDNEKGENYRESKRIEQKFLRALPTRYLYGQVIDKKTKKPVDNCEIKVKGTDSITYTDVQGYFSLVVPNNMTLELEIKKGTFHQLTTYELSDDFKKIKLRLPNQI